MKKTTIIGFALFLLTAIAIGTQWYDPIRVSTAYSNDKSGDWGISGTAFMAHQIAINSTGTMKPGDTVLMQFSDGTIAEFTLNHDFVDCAKSCKWSGQPWDLSKEPVIKQGPFPSGKNPVHFSLIPNITLPPMAIYPGPIDKIWVGDVDITQSEAAVQVFTSPSYPGGGGTGACSNYCPPVMSF